MSLPFSPLRAARARRALTPLLLAALALTVLTPPSSSVAAQGSATTAFGNVSAETDYLLTEALGRARRALGVSGLSFAVVGAHGRGWAGATGTDRGGSAIGVDTPLVIGSVTKTFVAAIIVDLAEQGLLSLDQPVSKFVPNTERIAPGVTLRQLLRHTSGVADLYAPLKQRLGGDPNHAFTSREVLGVIGAPKFKAGNGWSYSNTNYYLLGLVAESVTGRPFTELVQTVVAEPFGLLGTSLPTAETSSAVGLAPAWASSFWTSGAMVSTAADLAHWSRLLYGTNRLLEQNSRNSMVTIGSGAYGLGMQQMTLAGRTGWGHSGLLYSNTALMLYFPADHLGVAIIANGTNANLNWALTQRVNGDPSLLELARRFAAP